LGFSIMLQSNLSQPATRKFKKRHWDFWQKADADYAANFGIDAIKNIRLMEGVIIETVKMESGFLPSWNEINGSSEGKKKATTSHNILLQFLTHRSENDNVSRGTIRQLAALGNEFDLTILL
jgi:hypothetical protein